MSAERLSRLQGWILARCFEKVYRHDRSRLTLLSGFTDGSGNLDERNAALYWRGLYRQEILLDFYKLETDTSVALRGKLHAFKGENTGAHVSLTRSLKGLESKGLVLLTGDLVTLTEAGVETALQVLTEQSST